MIFQARQEIAQLEKRKGGYFYLTIPAEIVNGLARKRNTRVICTLDGALAFPCGFNHLGDGNYFIILSSANLKILGKHLGDTVAFLLTEDPNPLGVAVPEVLQSLLEQDAELRSTFERLLPSKQRNVIHQLSRIKNIDHQIARAPELIYTATKPRPKRQL